MNPWAINPTWQNYSSMIREAVSAEDATTSFERTHHLTAALYFGIAALEAFINQKTRAHLQNSYTEEAIIEVLRYGSLRKPGKDKALYDKLSQWPAVLTGRNVTMPASTWGRIAQFNDLRGNLTHSKTTGHDLYGLLQIVRPSDVVDTVAEYIAQYHSAEETQFPYWLWGWNYLNPQENSYDIWTFSIDDFVMSMGAIGFRVKGGDLSESNSWRRQYMSDMVGYTQIAGVLCTIARCERRPEWAPFRPVLCRRWWDPTHQQTCGKRGTTEAFL